MHKNHQILRLGTKHNYPAWDIIRDIYYWNYSHVTREFHQFCPESSWVHTNNNL